VNKKIILTLTLTIIPTLITTTQTPPWRYKTGDYVVCVAWSPDSQLLAAGSSDNYVYVFDKDSNLKWRYKAGGDVECVAWSPDGSLLATGSEYGYYVFDRSGELKWRYKAGGWIKCVAWSPDGQLLAAGSWDDYVYVFDRSGLGRVVVCCSLRCRVFVDGVCWGWYGAGSCLELYLPPGRHVIVANFLGVSFSREIEVGAGDVVVVDFSTEVSMLIGLIIVFALILVGVSGLYFWWRSASVVIEVDPVSAEIYVDGVKRKTGRFVRLRVKRGKHKISVRADGYEKWEREVVVDKKTVIKLSLKPIKPTAIQQIRMYEEYLRKLEEIKNQLRPEVYEKLKKEYEEKIRRIKEKQSIS